MLTMTPSSPCMETPHLVPDQHCIGTCKLQKRIRKIIRDSQVKNYRRLNNRGADNIKTLFISPKKIKWQFGKSKTQNRCRVFSPLITTPIKIMQRKIINTPLQDLDWISWWSIRWLCCHQQLAAATRNLNIKNQPITLFRNLWLIVNQSTQLSSWGSKSSVITKDYLSNSIESNNYFRSFRSQAPSKRIFWPKKVKKFQKWNRLTRSFSRWSDSMG